MKSIIKSIAFLILTVTILFVPGKASAQVAGQDPTAQTQDLNITIDNLGDANWVVSTKMNQAQWENFEQMPLYKDPSIAKRDMERAMSTFVIEDFDRKIDDGDHTATMTLKVKAMANYSGNGKWVLNLNMKNPDVSKLADNSYLIESNTIMNGQIVKQRYKISFPGSAKNILQATDSFGNAIFTYSMGGGISAYLKWNNIVGLVLIIAAVVAFLNLNTPKKPDIIGPDHQIEHTGLKV